MDRRSFLSASTVGTGALIAGCTGGVPRASMAASEERELIERLERGLSEIREMPVGVFASALRRHARPDLAERILRLGIEALVVLDVVRSIPPGVPVSPALSSRLEPELRTVDRYASTYYSLLRDMPERTRARMTTKVRERPELPMDIAGWIDQQARRMGVTPESCGALRRVAWQLGARMRRQSPGAVIDECVAKIERAMERNAEPSGRASRAKQLAEEAWEENDASALGSSLASPSDQPEPSLEELDREWEEATRPDPPLWSAQWARPGDEEREIGSIMMPFGALTCGLLTIVGLAVWVAGVIQNAEWDGTPRSEQ